MGLERVTTVLALLALVGDGLVALAVAGFVVSRVSPEARRAWAAFRYQLTPLALPLAWIVAVVATLGSLYMSEIAGLTPCQLCWFQRIAMYPLSLLLGIAAFRRDVDVAKRYFIWLPIVGAALAAYHFQLERFPNQPTLSCSLEAPCSVPVVDVWGFGSVPFMALAAFLLISSLLLLARQQVDDDGEATAEPRALGGR